MVALKLAIAAARWPGFCEAVAQANGLRLLLHWCAAFQLTSLWIAQSSPYESGALLVIALLQKKSLQMSQQRAHSR